MVDVADLLVMKREREAEAARQIAVASGRLIDYTYARFLKDEAAKLRRKQETPK